MNKYFYYLTTTDQDDKKKKFIILWKDITYQKDAINYLLEEDKAA